MWETLYKAYKAYFILILFVCNAFRMTRISKELRHHVIIKMKKEANQKKVARHFNMCISTVRKIWLKFLKTKTVSDLRKSARPCLLSERGHRDLIILAKKSPFCGPLQLLEGAKCYPSMSRSTIQRYFRNPNKLVDRGFSSGNMSVGVHGPGIAEMVFKTTEKLPNIHKRELFSRYSPWY